MLVIKTSLLKIFKLTPLPTFIAIFTEVKQLIKIVTGNFG